KGPYFAQTGDFSLAGSASLDYLGVLEAPFVEVTRGSHDFRRLLAAGSRTVADRTWLGAIEIEGNDAMQFNKSAISVPQSCKQFTVKLKHAGKLPKTAMGHNWVLAKTADMQGASADGMAAGAEKNYVKDGDKRVIAHTKLLGGGESDAVTFPVASLKAGEAYTYFCSFPGHSALMK
ncbi:azurin, partial [Raoultella sp. 18086]|uniref:azurin n=1 Tax=Raoultella sp. 18086 TaxID=2681418 RepID=UPI00190F3A38